MTRKQKILPIITSMLFLLTIFSGCIEQGGNWDEKKVSIAANLVNPKCLITANYALQTLELKTKPSSYTLPINLTNVENLDEIRNLFRLSEKQEKMLTENGFVVVKHNETDIIQTYQNLRKQEIPIFVTTDTLLHLYHVQFDEILKRLEEEVFFNKTLLLTQRLFEQSKKEYKNINNETLREAARRNTAFFNVALLLLQTPTPGYNNSEKIPTIKIETPRYVKNEVEKELVFITEHDSPHESPLFHYREDYTQYKPRGHYTLSEKLRRYFKTMMWLSRMTFLMKGGEPYCEYCDYLVSKKDALIQTIQASLISINLLNLVENNEKLIDTWTQIYSVTSFFVGTADDLTPYEYLTCLKKVFGENLTISMLTSPDKNFKLVSNLSLLRSPRIYGGTGDIAITPPLTPEKLSLVLDKTKGMRFIGQRFIPDSYMFQQLVSPTVGTYSGNRTDENKPFTLGNTPGGATRCFPRGLDVMAVLGSQRAYEILKKEGDTDYMGINTSYDKQLRKLRQQFEQLNDTSWNRNLYYGWLYTLKTLIEEYNQNQYPVYMTTKNWSDKELNTALASWTELKHDTILYGKQSYTPRVTAAPHEPQEKNTPGQVEPTPLFYNKLLALTEMTEKGLLKLNVLNNLEKNHLQLLQELLRKLIDISTKELMNINLSESDNFFIRHIDEHLGEILSGAKKKAETTMIADVHTDLNSKQCLEEALGELNLVLVVFNVSNKLVIGCGPVLSYYEFKQPISNRLTDEEWRNMVSNNLEKGQPNWINSFLV